MRPTYKKSNGYALYRKVDGGTHELKALLVSSLRGLSLDSKTQTFLRNTNPVAVLLHREQEPNASTVSTWEYIDYGQLEEVKQRLNHEADRWLQKYEEAIEDLLVDKIIRRLVHETAVFASQQ